MTFSACVFALAILFGGVAVSINAAQFPIADVVRIRYQEHALQPGRLEGGGFSDLTPREPQDRQFKDVIGYTNVFASSHRQHRVKKGGLTFSPRAFIKPVMFVEELYAFFRAYQDGEIEAVDGMAYVPLVVAKPRIVSFMLYYRNVYGVYVHIIW